MPRDLPAERPAPALPGRILPRTAPTAGDRRKPTARQLELEAQRLRDVGDGRLVELGDGGAWRRRCPGAP
jgi:hypothetical protein